MLAVIKDIKLEYGVVRMSYGNGKKIKMTLSQYIDFAVMNKKFVGELKKIIAEKENITGDDKIKVTKQPL